MVLEKSVEVPQEVSVEISGKKVVVKGPKGQLERGFKAPGVEISQQGKELKVVSQQERRKNKALVGTVTSHLKNMIHGVQEGFSYRMRVVYAHFPITTEIKENQLLIKNFIGEKTPRKAQIAPGAEVKQEGKDLLITAANKEIAGQTAANIENATRLKKRDQRIFQDGIYIVEKPKI